MAKPDVLAPKMTDENAVTVLNSLLKNIYRSFDFREEEDVYDRLATSVNGEPALGNLFAEPQINGGDPGRRRPGRVKEVKILDVDVTSVDDRPLGLLFHARWTAMGTVGHWGHIHMRKNLYDANIIVEPVEGAWKITNLELLEEQRIDPYAQPKT